MKPKSLEAVLRAHGVHPDNPTLGEIAGDFQRKVYTALCDSWECSRRFHVKKIRKHVANGTTTCPDCGHGLFWKEEKE